MIGPGQGGMNAPGGAGSSANASTARLTAIIPGLVGHEADEDRLRDL
jgi:hypothetical protein